MLGDHSDKSGTSFAGIAQPAVFCDTGYDGTVRAANTAEAVGIPITPHGRNVPPGAFIFAVICRMLDRFRWYRPGARVANGNVQVPAGMGLGIELDAALLSTLRPE